MKKHHIIYIVTLLFGLSVLASCSESSGEVEEYPNWKATNDDYFENLYVTALANSMMGNTGWRVIRNWSFGESAADKSYEHIVVEVLKNGTGPGCPLYTDSVKVHYEGRLLPSTSHEDGYVFDKSFYGDFNPATAIPTKFAVSGVIDGFSTALQYMRIGDRWRVYIPYQLGYGEVPTSGIPAYSVLVYDITLVSYYRTGVQVPDSKAKPLAGWIEE